VDAAGCSASQKDADQDRVMDNVDQCPATPAGEAVDQAGCSATQRDTDADGVKDNVDQCVNTPSGAQVDQNGCSPEQRDSDGDHVMDTSDACPNTPAGQQVDARGCPMEFGVMAGVTFATGTANLTEPAQAKLLDVARSLAADPNIKVEVAGHTDNTGSRSTNMRISQQRADAVAKFLTDNGVAASQVTAKGYGPDKPIASNATSEGRAQNRRVELNRVQ
jgi:OOP family OmpA-OmpF porin